MPRGGVIRDESVRLRVAEDFAAWAEAEGWEVDRVIDCPVAGGSGNRELLALVRTPERGDTS